MFAQAEMWVFEETTSRRPWTVSCTYDISVVSVFWPGRTAIKGSWSWCSQDKMICWDGLPSKKIEIDAVRTRRTTGWGKCHPEGSRHLWREGDHDDNGSWCEPWESVKCTGWRPGIYNTLPDHNEMTVWWIKAAGSKVEIGSWNALGRTRSDGMIHVIRPIIPANWKRQDTYDMYVYRIISQLSTALRCHSYHTYG